MKDDTQTPEPLLNAIRAEAATLELNTQPEPEPAPAPTPDSGLDTEDLLTENPRLPIRKSYHFQEFMPLEGEAFVRSAFLCILQREPDSSGLKTYLEQLHKGEKKPFILEALARSKEGAPYGIRIRGLFIYRLFLRLQRIPLIRPLASFLFTLYLRICSRLSADDLNLLHARIMQHLSNTDRRTRLLQAQQETLIEIVGHLQEYQTAYNAPKLEQALANINHKLAYQQQQWARLHSTTPAEQAPDTTPAPGSMRTTPISPHFTWPSKTPAAAPAKRSEPSSSLGWNSCHHPGTTATACWISAAAGANGCSFYRKTATTPPASTPTRSWSAAAPSKN